MKRPKADSANPKDSLGVMKVSFKACPTVARIYWALAMDDGNNKYGIYNYRNKKILMSVYIDAMERHIAALKAGEDFDNDPRATRLVPHVGRIMACASIIEDARACGALIDDRSEKDATVSLLQALTNQNYTAQTLKTTRTPARTLDEVRGGPQSFDEFLRVLSDGNRGEGKKSRRRSKSRKRK